MFFSVRYIFRKSNTNTNDVEGVIVVIALGGVAEGHSRPGVKTFHSIVRL